jgi:hypothetical protein
VTPASDNFQEQCVGNAPLLSGTLTTLPLRTANLIDFKSLVTLIYERMQQIFLKYTRQINRNSVVDMAIGLVNELPRDRGSFLGRGKIFFCTQRAQIIFLFQLELCVCVCGGGGGSFPRLKRSRREPDNPPSSIADKKSLHNCTFPTTSWRLQKQF